MWNLKKIIPLFKCGRVEEWKYGIFRVEVDDLGQRCIFLPLFDHNILKKRFINYPELYYKQQTSTSFYYLI